MKIRMKFILETISIAGLVIGLLSCGIKGKPLPPLPVNNVTTTEVDGEILTKVQTPVSATVKAITPAKKVIKNK